MFNNSYQAGLFLEVLDPKQNDPKNLIKLSSSIKKIYDKNIKGNIYEINQNHVQKIQLPKDEKMELGLIQPFLIIQIFIPETSFLQIEIILSDQTKVFKIIIDKKKNSDLRKQLRYLNKIFFNSGELQQNQEKLLVKSLH